MFVFQKAAKVIRHQSYSSRLSERNVSHYCSFRMLVKMTSFLIIFLVIISAMESKHTTVKRPTLLGDCRGVIEKSRGGRQFFAFYGIPYAEPPVGDLRFENPVPPNSWRGVKDCTRPASPCMSIERNVTDGQEDCLYLNVFTPKLISPSPLPVIVFVHGGRFMYGSSSPARYGPHYFMDRDVILITFNYRLGVLGFLSSGDRLLPGNYGLKDFVAVLEWIQQNIASFNGDKNRVTIAGGSSGAVATTFALFSPSADGLYHRCISQSVPMNAIIPGGIARRRLGKVLRHVGCYGDAEEIITCLKSIPATTLIKENDAFHVLGEFLPFYVFGPVIEDEKSPKPFLLDLPERLLSRRTYVPWIVGMNSDEGGMNAIFNYYGFDKAISDQLASKYDSYFPMILLLANNIEEAVEFKPVADRLKEYFFWSGAIEQHPKEFARMINLVYIQALKTYVSLYRGPKYVYYYAHKNEESFGRIYGNVPPEMDFGVIHGDELISFFNWSEAIKPVTSGVDLIVSEQLLDLWTNFAAFGDPNGLEPINNIWQPHSSESKKYLHIKDGNMTMYSGLLQNEFLFLDEIFDLVSKILNEDEYQNNPYKKKNIPYY